MEYKLSAVISKEENFFVARGIEIELVSQGMTVEEAFELWLKHADEDELKIFKDQKAPIVTQVAVTA